MVGSKVASFHEKRALLCRQLIVCRQSMANWKAGFKAGLH
jgi:hypothetical protein